jgi:replicative DNA helicase
MFLTKKALQKGLELLDGSEFYLDNHSKIFECIKNLEAKGSVVDITTVADELINRNWLKQVGDIDYLTEIIESVPSAAGIDEYIRIVSDKAILRRLIDEATSIITESYNTSNNISEVIETAEKKIFEVSKSLRSTEFKSIQDVLYKTQADIEKLSKNKGDITGIPTGYYELDKLTSGFHPHELIIVAARPGMGKTAIALNFVTNIAINSKKTVALFNMEMGAEQLATRMLSSVGQIEGSKLKTGNLEHSDWKRLNEAISRLSNTKIFIDDTAGQTVGEIRSKCRKLATSPSGLDLVLIDYLTLIQGSSKNGANRQQEVADISRALKTMAMELNVPVIALSQLSRGIEQRVDKKPMLSDLRESGAIEQDADIVAFLHCTDEERAKENSLMEFVIRKHRNGPLADVPLIFQRGTSTFVNVANVKED